MKKRDMISMMQKEESVLIAKAREIREEREAINLEMVANLKADKIIQDKLHRNRQDVEQMKKGVWRG